MQWKKLLHIPKKDDKSEIIQKSFFLSKTYDRKKELLTTIEYFINNKNTNDEIELAICRYGARYEFLNQHLDLWKYMKHPLCKERDLFIKKFRATSISIVFASSYLNSPASQAGHIFLKFDNNLSDVSSYTIGFGANITNNDSVLEYSYKGIMGKYAGTFDIAEYSKKIKEYLDTEQRHFFEYQLRLNANEVHTAILHLYELKGVKKPYYFMSQNCASQLLHIIQVAKKDSFLTNDFFYEISPMSLLMLLKEKNLLFKEKIRASLKSKISFLFSKMTKEEKEVFLIKKQDIFLQAYKKKQHNNANLIDTRIYNLRYQYLQEDINKSSYVRNYLILLRKRASIKTDSTKIESDIPSILNFHHSRRLRIGYIDAHSKNYLQIGYRPFYHGIEDIEEDSRNGYLEYLSGTISINKNNVILDSLILVNTQTYTPSKEPFSNFAWLFRLSYENDKRKYLLIKHALGKSYDLTKKINTYFLLSYALKTNKDFNFLLNAEVGTMWITKFGKMGLRYTHKIYDANNKFKTPQNKLHIFTTIKSKSNNLSYSLFYKQYSNKEIGININYYF